MRPLHRGARLGEEDVTDLAAGSGCQICRRIRIAGRSSIHRPFARQFARLPSHRGDLLDSHNRWRCHQSLEMDYPERRPVQPPEVDEVVGIREAGGLYRHYERVAA
jgi:hypothetical protein